MNLNKLDKEQIKLAVEAAEKKTRGEIVPMVLKRSDAYPAAHFRAAIMIGLALGFALYYLPFYEAEDALIYIWTIMGGMLLGYCLCFHRKIKTFFLSKKEVAEEVHQRALESFFHEGVHNTRERTGILLFISTLEHRAELIADCGINEKVDKEAWDEILRHMLLGLKEGNPGAAISKAVEECGALLEKHFPFTGDQKEKDVNELSDKVITD
jgi:putative membrane protein